MRYPRRAPQGEAAKWDLRTCGEVSPIPARTLASLHHQSSGLNSIHGGTSQVELSDPSAKAVLGVRAVYIEEGAQDEGDGSSGSGCGPRYILTCEMGLYLPQLLPWAAPINEGRQGGSYFVKSFQLAGAGVTELPLFLKKK